MRKAYETKFRNLLQRAGARKLDAGVRQMIALADALSASRSAPPGEALHEVYRRLARHPCFRTASRFSASPRFFCDSGLGGLARWLRASGYDALWEPGIDDAELLRRAQSLPAVIITTDSILMERGLLRDGIVPALWLPPILGIREQLRMVFCEFGLTLGAPRCMACGGKLRRADKETAREQIPPRTWRWLDDYFICLRCGKLYWHGTHWQKIQHELRRLQPAD